MTLAAVALSVLCGCTSVSGLDDKVFDLTDAGDGQAGSGGSAGTGGDGGAGGGNDECDQPDAGSIGMGGVGGFTEAVFQVTPGDALSVVVGKRKLPDPLTPEEQREMGFPGVGAGGPLCRSIQEDVPATVRRWTESGGSSSR